MVKTTHKPAARVSTRRATSQTDKFFEARIVEEGGVLHANL
ncbi:MAG: hypothetical protein QMC90_04700 [Dehalococcoidales bacterium]|nr:hypothetical protein [Dehalococcoidales bacterium]